MSWWSTSWLPSIPSIDFSLPSGIQKRFISFTLRRTLGHLLKPGQLDIQQVDSQIGSGYVQIRDVELDNDVSLRFRLVRDHELRLSVIVPALRQCREREVVYYWNCSAAIL